MHPSATTEPYFGFFWVTGLATDGAIVVANSYGLAYIPARACSFQSRFFMATADDSIPAAERAQLVYVPCAGRPGLGHFIAMPSCGR